MMQNILEQLEKVKRVGDSQWLACCPSHDDRTPSLAIKDTDDKILLRCWAGCSTESIVPSLGMKMGDLFHTSLSPQEARTRRHSSTIADAEHERLILAIASSDRKRGKRLSPADLQRERTAYLKVTGEKRV